MNLQVKPQSQENSISVFDFLKGLGQVVAPAIFTWRKTLGDQKGTENKRLKSRVRYSKLMLINNETSSLRYRSISLWQTGQKQSMPEQRRLLFTCRYS